VAQRLERFCGNMNRVRVVTQTWKAFCSFSSHCAAAANLYLDGDCASIDPIYENLRALLAVVRDGFEEFS
jgi:hypothetical protein